MSFIARALNNLVIYMLILVLFLCTICTVFGVFFRSDNIPDYSIGELKADYIYHYNDSESTGGAMDIIKTFTAFFINYNTLIPLSLMVCIEILKSLQASQIEKDPSLKEATDGKMKVLSLKIHEDLGNLKYVFTDKTGTLTKNEMEISSISIFSNLYDEIQPINADNEELAEILEAERGIIKRDAKESKFFSEQFDLNKLKMALKGEILPETEFFSPNSEVNSLHELIEELFINIAVNNNVLIEKGEGIQTPDIVDTNSVLSLVYQGSNPDEVTLVSASKDLKIAFLDRDSKSIQFFNQTRLVIYTLLYKFDFTSARMRSSIIVRDENNRIKLYIKGADSVILTTKKLSEFSSRHILYSTKNHLEVFAKKGLRTLCYAYRIISEEEYRSWEESYTIIKEKALEDKTKNNAVEDVISSLETKLTLLGVTGITDKLQESVPETLNQLLEADINVWMLTGDKADTAESIGFSCKLFRDDSEIFKIKSGSVDETYSQIKSIILSMIKLEKESSKNNFKQVKNQTIEPIKEILEDYKSEEDESFSSFIEKIKENFEEDNPNIICRNERLKSFDHADLSHKKSDKIFKNIFKNTTNFGKHEVGRQLHFEEKGPEMRAVNQASTQKCLEERNLTPNRKLNVLPTKDNLKSASPSNRSSFKQQMKAKEIDEKSFVLKDIGNADIHSIDHKYRNTDTIDLQSRPIHRKGSFHFKSNKKKKYKPHEHSIMKFMWDKDFFNSQTNSILERNLTISKVMAKEKTDSIVENNPESDHIEDNNDNLGINVDPEMIEVADNNIVDENEFKEVRSIKEVDSENGSEKGDQDKKIEVENFNTFNPKRGSKIRLNAGIIKNNPQNLFKIMANSNKSAAVPHIKGNIPHIQVTPKNKGSDCKLVSGASTPNKPRGSLAALIISEDNKNNSTTTLGSLMKDYEEKIKVLNSKKKNFMNFNLKAIVSNYFNGSISTEGDEITNNILLHFGLIIDGPAISYCLHPKNAELFWKLLSKSKSIICARCSPVQKADVVNFVKKQSGEVTLAIGDGGNDVNMIKCANVGVGIFGKEGYQAAFNSDYALDSFKFLKTLIFKHGRFSLNRNSYFAYFFFFKNLIFTFHPFWFSLYNGFSGQQYFDDWYYLGYNSFMASLPIMVKSFIDEDFEFELKKYKHKDLLK